MAVVGDCGFELVDHPTYSHDLDPSGYHLVLKQEKKTFDGDVDQHLSDNDVISAVYDFLN